MSATLMTGPPPQEPMKTQQKCIAIFGLLCGFAVLSALIFSSVDIWGDDDGITEENCNSDCRIELVENIPEDLLLPIEGRPRLSLSAGFNILLDQAKRSVEVVSPVWALNPWDLETTPSTAKQGQLLFQRLLSLKSHGVKLKIASSLTNSPELKTLAAHKAEIRFLNMTALTRGELRSSFWIVDRKHIYIGSADMDWRSLSKRKELGLVLYNCSCLALDLHRVFSFYWQLHDRDYIPSIWSKRVTALYGRHDALELRFNSTEASAYLSTSPEVFCSKDRTRDVDAIYQVIQSAKTFIFISVTDYLPLVSSTFRGTTITRYWSLIDEMIREAVVLRGVQIRLLISFWKKTHPLTFNFVVSLKSLCIQLHNCSLEVRFFSHKEQKEDFQHGLNHNKYLVTDNALYVGNHDWVGSDFARNAGVGLVVKMKNSFTDRGVTVIEHVKAAFERDWRSRYAKSLQSNKDQYGKYRDPLQNKIHMDTKEESKWNDPLSL
ncbi:inactive phospholipase D5 isoform X2 [Notolabrus celidotus]|uniref:inactive phospholipase D5 isoform X2 n=1 Tax=Notolabrus celidotus TaxID=1203425 RepID=UPI00148F71EF|nr:inactive phospholipase D5 isoform X2 [Notolabrus celidotus]